MTRERPSNVELEDAWLRVVAGNLADDWALNEMTRCAEEEPQRAFDIILDLIRRGPSKEVLGQIGAGPLEELISANGREIIDRLEAEAVRNPDLADLLNGVYRLDTPDDVWRRVVKISGREREM